MLNNTGAMWGRKWSWDGFMIVIKEKIEVIPVIAGEIQGWLEKNIYFFIILENPSFVQNCKLWSYT